MNGLNVRLFNPLNREITDWNDRRIWIIGASSGIGAALANNFLSLGARVILSARRLSNLEQVAAGAPKAMILPFDVQDSAAWKASFQTILDHWEGIDLIIFCSAKYQPERIWEVEADAAKETLAVNLESVYQGIALTLPSMLNAKCGGVAIIASVAGYVGLPNASVYGPSKAALINLAEVLYTDLHPKGLQVYLINPGFVRTELTEKNQFFMPALQTAEQAAHSIIRGMEAGSFEIHFPKRFTFGLKLLQMLPYRLRFAILKRIADK